MDIITATFNHSGTPHRVTQFRGGPLEVYSIGADGLESWKGYASKVSIDLAERAWDAFQAAPGQRWLFQC